MKTNISLYVKPDPGADIANILQECSALAKQLDMRIRFDANDCLFSVNPNLAPSTILKEYHHLISGGQNRAGMGVIMVHSRRDKNE
jgi:hypothetical protein